MANRNKRRAATIPRDQRRWTPYICQDCRAIFRIPANYTGTGVVCPKCERMLRLPKSGEEVPKVLMANVASPATVDEDLPSMDEANSAQAVAQSETLINESEAPSLSVEPESQKEDSHDAPEISISYTSRILDTFSRPPQQSRRRKKHRNKSEKLESEWQNQLAPFKLKFMAAHFRWILGCVLGFAAILLLIFIASFFKQPPKTNTTASQPSEIPAPTLQANAKAAIAKDKYLAEVPVIQAVVQAFLKARTVDEMLPLVRQSSMIKDRIYKHYQQQPYEVPGFSHIDDASENISEDGALYTALVATADFSQKSIAVVKEGGKYLVDWESWVGWSVMSFNELMRTKPTNPIEVRVIVETHSYYNYDFPPEKEHLWQSYRLVAPDGMTLLYGYVAKASGIDNALRLSPDQVSKNAILRIKFPENSTSDTQVLIDEIVADGWLKLDAPK